MFTTLEGHSDQVTAVAWLSNGLLASASLDKTIKLWDVTANKESRTIPTPNGAALALAANHDGSLLASGGKGGTIRLWSLLSNDASPRELASQSKSVVRLAFSADGKWLASCAEEDSRVTIWDVAQGKSLKTLNAEDPEDKNQRRTIFAATFSPDGKLVASCGADRTARLFDAESGKEQQRFEGDEYLVFKEKDKKIEREVKAGASRFALYAVAFSPDGKQLAAGGLDRQIHLWDTVSGKLVRTISDINGFVQDLRFVTGEEIFSATHNGSLRISKVASDESRWSQKLSVLIASAAVSNAGQIAAAGADGKVYLAKP